MQNLHQIFDWQCLGQIISQNFVAFSEYTTTLIYYDFVYVCLYVVYRTVAYYILCSVSTTSVLDGKVIH